MGTNSKIPPKLEIVVNNDNEELDLPAKAVHPKNDWRGPPDIDWLSPMSAGTEFKCHDKLMGRRWQVMEFTHLGKLKGDVLLSPTVFIDDPKAWFWVEPVSFCKEWEFRGVIEIPGETSDVSMDSD